MAGRTPAQGGSGDSRDEAPASTPEDARRADDERNLLRTIVDALPDYIHVKDETGRFRLANKAWLAARRYSRAEEIQGKTVFDVFPAPIAQRMQEQDQHIMETGEAVLEQETPVVLFGEDGSQFQRWSVVSKVPLRDEEGRIVGILGISRDITARRRLERERAMEHAVARVLSDSHSVQDTMPPLLRTICEAMGWIYGARWIWDPVRSNLRRAEWWCERAPEFDAADEHYWLELGPGTSGGLLRSAWLERHPTWLADIQKVDTFRRKPSCSRLGWRSAFAFPIIADEERFGVLEFFGREVREPDEELLQVSGALAAQIGQFMRRRQAEEALADSEQQLRAMFDNANVGIAVTGLDLRYLRVNDKFCRIMGYPREELLRMRIPDLNLESNVETTLENRERLVASAAESTTMEKQLVRNDGSLVWVSVASSLVRASDGAPRYFLAVIQDISESKRAADALRESEEQFRRLAQYDMLTALPNRGLFHDRLGHAIAQTRRDRSLLAVLFVDIDHFKDVNDTFGHAAGDQILKQISQRLSACVRGNDTVGRLSGDEFAVVLSGLAAPRDAATVAQKILAELDRPYRVEDAQLSVTASVGIAICPDDGNDPDVLIRYADVAMYRAKERGRNTYQLYEIMKS